ncbi:DUF6442 family protein [Clostridioides sp. ES-S-0048-02]|uniref:DUF6442 family protein n=1 Tax=Clostridioides sp. ES-S-0048-02 TaxID=2770777 RepID=UPI001D1086BB|nr:hypothetical protein [Clostridioides sp. ES-S-0048-02]
MNKEEILERSRQEKSNEGYLFILNKGQRYGTLLFVGIIVPLIILNLIKLRTTDLSLLLTILWGWLTGNYYGSFKALNKKSGFIILLSSIITLSSFIYYITQVF